MQEHEASTQTTTKGKTVNWASTLLNFMKIKRIKFIFI